MAAATRGPPGAGYSAFRIFEESLRILADKMLPPRKHGVLPGYLRQARAILAARPAHLEEGPTRLPPDFEALRWFPLPPACLLGHCEE